MVVYLSDGERGGERHFVGKAEAETGEGDAPFPRLGVATVHLVVASHASPAAWQLAAAEEEGWIMTLQTALALAQSLRDERRGDKYLFYFLTIYELGFGNLGHLVAVHLIYLHRSLFTILLDDDVLVVHSDCGVVSLYRGWCTVAVGFS